MDMRVQRPLVRRHIGLLFSAFASEGETTMKVVLFCGGLGMRMREYSETVPKPMVKIGHRPLLWYLMKYYAYYGHKDFVLCLGYKGEVIKEYFINYQEYVSNDFVLCNGGKEIEFCNTDIQDWRITFVDTGLNTSIGQRLRAVERFLDGEEMFLANYSDGLTSVCLNDYIDFFKAQNRTACFLLVQPASTFHVVNMGENNTVSGIADVVQSNLWVNGGFFIFRRKIFDYIYPNEDLVYEPFQRLIKEKNLVAYKANGFWACMDTFKEKRMFDDMFEQGKAPWEVWRKEINSNSPRG
jgi:glucose-1-phosphate cytidylyltransferase